VAEQKCIAIEISKNYRITEFREDLKNLYRIAGAQNKPTTFLFDETQIKYETFVEDINNILTSGEVPNLFTKEEIGGVVDEVRLVYIAVCFQRYSRTATTSGAWSSA
jgi:dynein heavy chain, axonemal